MRIYRNREYKYEWNTLYLKCVECWERKTDDSYCKQRWGKFWLRSQCKECQRLYRQLNKDRDSKYSKIYRENNKDKIRNYNKERYQKDRDRILDVARVYRETHREQRNKHNREYRLKKREETRERCKQYYQNNREKVLAYHKDYYETRNNELWFNLRTFHTRANKYVKSHNLTPSECPICWSTEKVEMHHPSYDKYENWSKVVFCCSMCHKRIHSGVLECPEPINILDSNDMKKWQTKA